MMMERLRGVARGRGDRALLKLSDFNVYFFCSGLADLFLGKGLLISFFVMSNTEVVVNYRQITNLLPISVTIANLLSRPGATRMA